MSRPEKRNAWTPDMFEELRSCFIALERDPSVNAIVLTGAGGNFASGADLSGFGGYYTDGISVESLGEFLAAGRGMKSMLGLLERTPKPIIAAIEGVCVGRGLEL